MIGNGDLLERILEECKALYDMNTQLAETLHMDPADSVIDNCVIRILDACAEYFDDNGEGEDSLPFIQSFAWEDDFGRAPDAKRKNASDVFKAIVNAQFEEEKKIVGETQD